MTLRNTIIFYIWLPMVGRRTSDLSSSTNSLKVLNQRANKFRGNPAFQDTKFLVKHGEFQLLHILRFPDLPLQVHAEGLGISLFGTRTFKQRQGNMVTRVMCFFVNLVISGIHLNSIDLVISRSVCFTFGSLDRCWSRWGKNCYEKAGKPNRRC